MGRGLYTNMTDWHGNSLRDVRYIGWWGCTTLIEEIGFWFDCVSSFEV